MGGGWCVAKVFGFFTGDDLRIVMERMNKRAEERRLEMARQFYQAYDSMPSTMVWKLVERLLDQEFSRGVDGGTKLRKEMGK
jgi:hypothetical protein